MKTNHGRRRTRKATFTAVLGLAALAISACTANLPVSVGATRPAVPDTFTATTGTSTARTDSSTGPPVSPFALKSNSDTPGMPVPATSSAAAPHVSAAPSQIPGYAAESWTASLPGPFEVVTGHAIQLNECSSVDGATTWHQQGYTSGSGNSAILETYTFTAAATARNAIAGTESGMHDCQATSRALQSTNKIDPDATCRETASATDAAAYERTWIGVEGLSAAGRQTNHLYLAVRGTTVLVLHFDELATGSTAAAYDVANDPSVLTMLAALLATQAGGS